MDSRGVLTLEWVFRVVPVGEEGRDFQCPYDLSICTLYRGGIKTLSGQHLLAECSSWRGNQLSHH